MGKTYIVVGAGFRGFCDAMTLLQNPNNNVHIIESAPFFGGIAYSRTVKGFAVDKGVHMFDSIPRELASTIDEIMDGHVAEIDFISASAFNGVVTEGFSLPDLSSLDEGVKSKIATELIELAAKYESQKTPKNLLDLLHNRYGKTAGNVFADIFNNVYSVKAQDVQPDAISKTSLGRLKFLDDQEMMVLKAHPWLDTVLAARRKAQKKIDDYVTLYPNNGDAMKGWCERAALWLQKKGAKIHLGEKILNIHDDGGAVTLTTDKNKIEADRVIWSNDNIFGLSQALGFTFDTKNYVSGTPMIFATFITKAEDIKNFTYLQNFDPEGITYRTAAAGIFSNQVTDDGLSFITCECPTQIASEFWNNFESQYENIWQECKDLGVVAKNAQLVDHEVIRIPSTFKIGKIGYKEKVDEFIEILRNKSPNTILRDVTPFFRREIYLDTLEI